MSKALFCILLFLLFIVCNSYAQTDGAHNIQQLSGQSVNGKFTEADEKLEEAQNLKQVPDKYIKELNSKMDLYNKRMMQKTVKTLQKLSKWENKIHGLLLKTSPQIAQQLFGNGQETFGTMLQKIQQGQAVTQNYQADYDAYMDKVSTNLKYLQQRKNELDSNVVKPVAEANDKMAALTKEEDNTEAVQQFIKTRRKQLMNGAMQYIQSSKYLANINQESFYYIETMKNYKELFSDPDKAEQAAEGIINKIPAFQQFTQQNSILSSLFGLSPNNTDGSTQTAFAGIQSRANVQNMIQQRIPTSGPNADQSITQNIQNAQDQLGGVKDKLNELGGGSSADLNMPDGFKPNMQKTKTFLQRIEYGFNIQFAKSNSFLPASSDIAATIGYKLSDKNTIGVGIAYDLGLGSGGSLKNISLSSQGIGLRSYIDLKLKGSIWITGGYEQNYQSAFTKFSQLQDISAWQQSGLIGITKKYKVGNKSSNMQVLWDFLSYSQVPQTPPIKFRLGYTF
jgi:hypothetical protein